MEMLSVVLSAALLALSGAKTSRTSRDVGVVDRTARHHAVQHRVPLPPWRSAQPLVLQLTKSPKLALSATRRFLYRDQRALVAGHGAMWSEVTLLHALQYYGFVSLGTPAQQFRLTFDSGSSLLLLQSMNCSSRACQGSHRRYFANMSTTSEQIGWADKPLEKMTGEPDDRDTTVETFAMGEAVGVYARDNLCVAPSSCAKVDFVEAQEESDAPFDKVRWDGIFGLAPSSSSQPMEFNAIQQLYKQKAIQAPMFALYLGPRMTDQSEITLGSWKSSRAVGTPLWVPLSSTDYWQFALQEVTVDNVSVQVCSNGCQAVIDTGSSLLMGPQKMGNAIKALLYSHAPDCSSRSLAALPNIGFRVNGTLLDLRPNDYMDTSNDTCLFAWTSSLDQPEFQGATPVLVLGMPFLRRWYTIFDLGSSGPRLGFARARQSDDGKHVATPLHSVDVKLLADRPLQK